MYRGISMLGYPPEQHRSFSYIRNISRRLKPSPGRALAAEEA
jgi:hypothetical protein